MNNVYSMICPWNNVQDKCQWNAKAQMKKEKKKKVIDENQNEN